MPPWVRGRRGEKKALANAGDVIFLHEVERHVLAVVWGGGSDARKGSTVDGEFGKSNHPLKMKHAERMRGREGGKEGGRDRETHRRINWASHHPCNSAPGAP